MDEERFVDWAEYFAEVTKRLDAELEREMELLETRIRKHSRYLSETSIARAEATVAEIRRNIRRRKDAQH